MDFQKRQVMLKSKRQAANKIAELQEAAQIQLSLQQEVRGAGARGRVHCACCMGLRALRACFCYRAVLRVVNKPPSLPTW